MPDALGFNGIRCACCTSYQANGRGSSTQRSNSGSQVCSHAEDYCFRHCGWYNNPIKMHVILGASIR
jgi:hypothetical protein